ncbi:ABC transporter substrate-binding protein [Cupriavidus sp. PET2-C1]
MIQFARRLLVTSLSALLMSFACGQSYGQLIVKIGVSSPLTGINAADGKDIENGVRLAVEEANAQRIKLGGRDARFEIDSVDDQSDPRIGVQVAQKLVDEYGRPVETLPQGKAFLQKFRKRFGADSLIYAPFAYDATWVAINAIKQANSARSAELVSALRTTQYDGITGKIAFDPNGDLKNPTSTLYQVKGGRWVPVTTIGAE